MKVLKQNQYNQGVGKSKLFSSTSGVGSIITTKLGYYVLISDINKWTFVKWANSKVESLRNNTADDKTLYEYCQNEISKRGLTFIDDKRFIRFLRQEKKLDNLVCLVGIPHMALSENFNTPNWSKHPIRKALMNAGEEYNGVSDHYMINGTHFPKWFKNKKGQLKRLQEWYTLWERECKSHSTTLKMSNFSPPRDSSHFLRELDSKNEDGNPIKVREYQTLEQTNLILICPNGHLSDIPWPNFLRWKTEKQIRIRHEEDNGEDLLFTERIGPCCATPKLKWTESKTKSEGYASIFIECSNCGLGTNKDRNYPKVNLEGINSIQPLCKGEKPWEIKLDGSNDNPKESCVKSSGCRKCSKTHNQEHMQIALVTANNVYYANGFTSLFIPMHLAENKSAKLLEALFICNKKYAQTLGKSFEKPNDVWFAQKVDEEFLESDCGIKLDELNVPVSEFIDKLKVAFLSVETDDENFDIHEHYRWQEYQCFVNNDFISNDDINRGIQFKAIEIPEILAKFFKKIQQIDELKVTNVQLNFTRVKPKERIIIEGEIRESTEGKNIFSVEPNEVYVLPANETLGEGLFFQFDDELIDKWVEEHSGLVQRFSRFREQEINLNSQGAGIKVKIKNNGIKHFLIHSFSHILMRELEFSCGYPTASLKERLYISTNSAKKMSGVLIYTAEGSEGSMGGLVNQGEPERIVEIIQRGLERSIDCSSDPLCWESDGQGIFDLNLSACFSCSLVSETACEEMNLGLDRRVLVDEDFGMFKELLYTIQI